MLARVINIRTSENGVYCSRVEMAGSGYRGFLRVLERWPKDPSKAGRDVGEALRTRFAQTFPAGPHSKVDEPAVARQVESLERLVANEASSAFPQRSPTTFTGLDQETLAQITATEVMGQISEASELERKTKKGLMERIKSYRWT